VQFLWSTAIIKYWAHVWLQVGFLAAVVQIGSRSPSDQPWSQWPVQDRWSEMTIWIFGIGWLVAEAHELSNRARSRATHYASDGLSAVQKLRSLLSAHYSSMWNVLDLVLIGFVLLHILLTLIEQVFYLLDYFQCLHHISTD